MKSPRLTKTSLNKKKKTQSELFLPTNDAEEINICLKSRYC